MGAFICDGVVTVKEQGNKAYPGYNVIGLLLGPESNTQKRLEEETGAKVRIHGTKVDAGEKHEVPLSGISSDTQGAYEELYVHVSADTYEKVDAAVALIELLLTPVSGSSTLTSASTSSVAADLATPMTTVSQGVLQPSFMPAQRAPPQFHPYLTPWYPTAPSGAPHPPGGFMPVHRFPLPPGGPLNAPPYFGQPPFSSLPRTLAPPASRPQLPMQPNQAMPTQNRPMPGQHPPSQTMPPQNRPMPGQQPPPAYSVMRPHPSSAPPAQFSPAQPMPVSRPPLALNLQQAPAPMGTVPMRPLRAPALPGWPTAPLLITPPLRPANVTQMAPVSRPQPSFPTNMTNRPPIGNFAPPPFSSAPSMGPVSGPPMLSSSSGPPSSAPMPAPVPLITPISGPAARPALPPVQSPQPPPSVTPMRSPTVTAPKPVRPSSGDFTFQPLRAQVPPSPTTPGPTSPLVAPQAPSFRPAVQSSAQPSFSINPISIQPPPMLPFPNPRPVPPMASTTQMGPPSFTPAPQAPNLAPSTQMGRPVFPPPPATQMGRPGFSPLNQQFRGNQPGPVVGGPASSSGGNQIYDPFSPTSISPRPGGDPTKARKPETDAEYEDLMASVGVK